MIEKPVKRVLSALLALCMLFGMWNPGLTVHAEESTTPTTKVYDFESDAVDAVPAGFTAAGDSEGQYVKVVTEGETTNKVLLVKDPGKNIAPSATVAFPEQTEAFSVEFRIKFNAGTSNSQHLVALQNVESGAGADNQAATLLEQKGVMKNHNGSEWQTLLESYEQNVWYSVKMDADPVAKNFDITIAKEGGEPTTVNDISFRGNAVAAISYLCFGTAGNPSAEMYIDDVKVPAPASTPDPDPDPDPEPEPETDKTAPVWTSGAVKADNITADSAEVSYVPAADAESASKYQIQVNDSVAAAVDFTDVEELTFTLPGATVNHEGQGTVYLIKPKNIPEGVKLPVVIGLHGNNGSAGVFQTHTGIYGKIKDVALQNGYIFAAISNGADIWGQNNDAGVDNVKRLLDYLVATYNTQDEAALWAYSAGGVLANRMVMKYPDSVSFVVGTYPVFDLTAMYTNYDACTNAWGDGAGDAIRAIDPADHTDMLTNHKYYLTHGDADVTVPLATHSQAMKDALGSNVTLEIVSGGTHNSKDERFHSATALSAFAQNPPTVVYALSGLTAETEYSVSVKATDAKGNYATSNTATFTTTAAASGGEDEGGEEEEPASLPYDFENEAVGSVPSYVVAENVVANANTVTVEADPADAENQVLYLNDVPANSSALKANISIGAQTGKVDISFRIKAGDTSNDYIINLMGLKGEEQKQAARFLLRAGKLQRHNGSGFVEVEAYTEDTWYTVKFAMDIENSKYDLYIDGESIATDVSFVTSGLADVNLIQFTTSKNYTGEKLYIDNISAVASSAPVDPPVDPPEDEDAFVIDFEDGTVGAAPADEEITLMDTSETDTITVVADPKNADNKVMLIDRPVMATKPYALVKIPEQTGNFTVEYRIMFGKDAQYAALVQSGTENNKQGVYLLARDQEYKTNPGELLYHNGSAFTTLFAKSEFAYNVWYSVKVDVYTAESKYDITVTDANGLTKTATGSGMRHSGITAFDYLNFQVAGTKTGAMYVDDIKVSGSTQTPDVPVDPPVNPDDPEIPAAPAVAFDFQADTVGADPKYLTLEGESGNNTISVVADPKNADNKVMLLKDTTTSGSALKAYAPFENQTGTFVAEFKVRFATEGDDYIINLIQGDDDAANQGPRILAREGSLRYIDGKGNFVVFKDDYDVNAWYTVKIVSDISKNTYDLYVDGESVVKGAKFASTSITKLNFVEFTTTGKLCGEMYIDDIAVPNPIKVEPAVSPIDTYIPEYMDEQLLADGSNSTYLAFPSILKLSDEKVLIAYKATTAHMDVEADLDIIVYNPTTKQVVSKTTIDATVGEAAQNPELLQMPNGDLVIYLDVQRVTSSDPQQRYGIKEIRSTDGGATWKALAADGTYKNVDQVEKHGYKVLKDDKGIVYGYTFDDAIIGNDVYMLAMSFPEFASDPGRSVHLIKSSDNGATWTHVKNLNVEFDLKFNESSLEAYGEGLIINCRPDTNKTPSTYYVDLSGNLITAYKYEGYTDLIKTTNRPKLFAENGKYYLLGRNILSGTTTLCLYEIDPVTLAPLNYIELRDLPGHSTGNSFYAEYYLQEGADGNTYFNVITYDDTRAKGHPDIVRYEYAWEELLTQTPVVPEWPDDAVSVQNVADKTADVVFKAASDDEFVTKYTITLNGETAGTINFGEIEEKTFTLSGVKGKSDGQAYIAMPKNIPEGMKLPVVIAVHGSGRGALDYKNTAFYAEQKNIALANGYIFAAISNGSDTWGLDDGLYNINLFYDYLIANYPVQEKAALWATSAGGTLANRMVKDYPDKVSFVLGTFPVYDLLSGFNNVNSCKTAWGTTNLDTFKELIAGKNPAEFPNALKNHDYYIAHGSADVAVPIAENSQKMVTDVGSNVHLEVIEGGVHGTSNYAFYGDIVELAFEEHPAIYTYTLSGLTANTDYTVSVTASDADNYSVVSNTASFKTLAEGQQPEDPDEPDQPENPAVTYVTYDFEGEEPLKDVELLDTTENSPVAVVADPADANNHALKIIKAPQSVDGTANKVHIDFEKQEKTVEVSYKLRIGANTRFVINLYAGDTLGPRVLLEPDGRVRVKNGGSWADKATYTTDTWYTVKVAANVETDKYDVYLNGQQIATNMAFENAVDKLNLLSFATFGAKTAEVYVDDVVVPEPPVPLYYTPEYMVSDILFDAEGTDNKYTPFPSILKLSEEKVIIVYKRGTSHMDCEADMEAIVYNPTTEQVVSRTVLDATVGEAAQNPEIMQMPNGDLMIYLDVQRITGSGRQRYGVKQFRSTDQGETWKVLAADGTYKNVEDVPMHGFKILEDNTGIQYGYTFDDVIVGNDVYMLAMTFAEFNNDKAAPGRSTHIIKSSDNGVTWTHVKNLNEEFNFAFNESSLEVCGNGFMVMTRGDSGAKFRNYLVDAEFNMILEQTYEDYADIMVQCGRPKLFVEDGKYYLLCRNKDANYVMALYELDPVTLAPVSYISLDQFGGDSCYAESFFHEKHGQKFLNVINYGDRSGDGKPDILRTEYVWEELMTKQAVQVTEHSYVCEVETAAYQKKAATCDEGGEYYKSCSCGVLNENETFTTAALEHDWSNNDGQCANCGKIQIERTNMRFGSDLSLLFAVRQSHFDSLNGVTAKVTKAVAGAEGQVTNIPSEDWTTATIGSVKYYVVEFDGLAAKEMSDQVTVEIVDAAGNVLNVNFTTSVRNYAMEILGKTDKDDFKTAIVDMLNYGTAAQEYFDDYNIEEPANKLLNAEQRALASVEGTYEDKRVKDDTYFDASNLRFVSKINLIFRLKISKDTYAVFTWTDHMGNSKRVRVENTDYAISEGMYVVELDELVVADARQLVTCTIYNAADDSVVTTVIDSVESNAARRTQNVSKLYVEFMKFADSAHTYLQNK